MRREKLIIGLVTCLTVVGVYCSNVPVYAETYEYDCLNRVTKVSYEDGSYVEYDYDANGNIKRSEVRNSTTSEGNEKNDNKDDSNKTPTNNQNNTQKEPDEIVYVTTGKADYSIVNIQKQNAYAILNRMTDTKTKSFSVPKAVKYNGKSYPVTEIAEKAFYKNVKIKKLVIGENVEKIGAKAFYGTKNLKKITVKSQKLTSIGKQALKGINNKAVIKVPKQKLKKYKKLFKSKGQRKTVSIKK